MHLFLRSALVLNLKWIAPQPTQHMRTRRAYGLQAMSLLLLGVVIAGCGQSSSPSTSVERTPTTSTPVGRTPTAEVSSESTFLTRQNAAIDTTVAGLHIYSGGFVCDHHLVLATTRLSYDTAEIQQMRAVFNEYAGQFSNYGLGTLPATLQLVNTNRCSADLQITNMGTSAVEILRAGVKLLAVPVRNTYQYHFIDVCSVQTKINPCPLAIGSSPGCGVFFADVSLTTSTAGELAEGKLVPEDVPPPDGPCPAERPLNPGDSIDVIVTPSPTGSDDNLVYNIALALSIQSASGQQTLLVTHPQSTLVFTDATQYSCYKLEGTSFKLETQGKQALGVGQPWCE